MDEARGVEAIWDVGLGNCHMEALNMWNYADRGKFGDFSSWMGEVVEGQR